jgi:hypothetical protein
MATVGTEVMLQARPRSRRAELAEATDSQLAAFQLLVTPVLRVLHQS